LSALDDASYLHGPNEAVRDVKHRLQRHPGQLFERDHAEQGRQ
jgi:hypothetical protein